jgi:hypothetical protein
MKLTAISSPTNAVKIATGNRTIKNINIPLVNIGHNIPLNIFNKVWPATKLAKSRTPKLKARAT